MNLLTYQSIHTQRKKATEVKNTQEKPTVLDCSSTIYKKQIK